MRKVDSITTAKELDAHNFKIAEQFEILRGISFAQLERLEAIHEGIYELVNKPPEKYVPDMIKLDSAGTVLRKDISRVLKSEHGDQYFAVIMGAHGLSHVIEFDEEEARDKRYDDLLREWKGETTSD